MKSTRYSVISCLWLAVGLAFSCLMPMPHKVALCADIQAGEPPSRLVVALDISYSMHRSFPNVEKALVSIVKEGFGGRILNGGTVEIWPFDERVYPQAFGPEARIPELSLATAKRTSEFLKQLNLSKRGRMDAALKDLRLGLSRTPPVSLLLITDGDELLRGTPLDAQLNVVLRERRSALKQSKNAFCILIHVEKGAWTLEEIFNTSETLPPPVADVGRSATTFPGTETPRQTQIPMPAPEPPAQLQTQPASQPQPPPVVANERPALLPEPASAPGAPAPAVKPAPETTSAPDTTASPQPPPETAKQTTIKAQAQPSAPPPQTPPAQPTAQPVAPEGQKPLPQDGTGPDSSPNRDRPAEKATAPAAHAASKPSATTNNSNNNNKSLSTATVPSPDPNGGTGHLLFVIGGLGLIVLAAVYGVTHLQNRAGPRVERGSLISQTMASRRKQKPLITPPPDQHPPRP